MLLWVGRVWHRLVGLRVARRRCTHCSVLVLLSSLDVVRDSLAHHHLSLTTWLVVEYNILVLCLRTLHWHLYSLLLKNLILVGYPRSHITHLSNYDLLAVAYQLAC